LKEEGEEDLLEGIPLGFWARGKDLYEAFLRAMFRNIRNGGEEGLWTLVPVLLKDLSQIAYDGTTNAEAEVFESFHGRGMKIFVSNILAP
jgi:hypothetical protein